MASRFTASTPLPTIDSTGQSTRLMELEAENVALRQELAASRNANLQVQSRLDGLEGKFEWLSKIMSQQQPAQDSRLHSSHSSIASLSPSISPLELQQTSATLLPPSPLAGLDPTALIALLPPAAPISPELPSSSFDNLSSSFDQVASLSARERFLPRTTCIKGQAGNHQKLCRSSLVQVMNISSIDWRANLLSKHPRSSRKSQLSRHPSLRRIFPLQPPSTLARSHSLATTRSAVQQRLALKQAMLVLRLVASNQRK